MSAAFDQQRNRAGERLVDGRSYRLVSALLLAIVAAGAGYAALQERWVDAATFGGVAVLGAVFLAIRNRLPSLFTMLFLLAGALNTAGYVFGLWKTPSWFDEVAHAFTSFTVCAAIGWALLARTHLVAPGHGGKLFLAVIGIGIVLGLLWELFEWAIGIIDGARDTLIDLGMDLIGAIGAGLFCAWAARALARAKPDIYERQLSNRLGEAR